MSTKQLCVSLIASCIARFPFWEALSIMLLFGEMESKWSRKIQFPAQLVYIDVGLSIILGTFISFTTHWRRPCAVIAAFQMFIHSVIEFQFHRLKYDALVHIALRNLGVIACLLLIAAGVGENKKARRSATIQLSCFVFGIMLAGQAYMFAVSRFEQKIFKHTVLFKLLLASFPASIHVLTFCFTVVAYCFLTQRHGFDMAKKCSIILWLCVVLPIDFTFVREFEKVEIWTYIRLVVSSISTFGGLLIVNFIYM